MTKGEHVDFPLNRNSRNSMENQVVREILLTEYKTLRDEIFKKMDHRTTLSVSLLTVSVVALGAGLERRSVPLLLVVPMICVLFGCLIAFNNYSIYGITAYIRENIESIFNEWHPGLLIWHTNRRPRSTRIRELAAVYHVPNILAVTIPSSVGIVAAWSFFGPSTARLTLTAFDGVLLAFYITMYVRVTWRSVRIRPSGTGNRWSNHQPVLDGQDDQSGQPDVNSR